MLEQQTENHSRKARDLKSKIPSQKKTVIKNSVWKITELVYTPAKDSIEVYRVFLLWKVHPLTKYYITIFSVLHDSLCVEGNINNMCMCVNVGMYIATQASSDKTVHSSV